MSAGNPGGPDEVELLNVAEPVAEVSETVTTETSRGGALAIIAALALAALGVAALTTSGADEAAPPTTTPTPAPDLPDTQTSTPRDGGPTAVVGDGPMLDWERIEAEVDATMFVWVGDNFYATGGTADMLLRPGPNGVSVSFLGTGDESIDRSMKSSSEVFSRSPTNPDVLYFPANSRLQTLGIASIPPGRSELVEPSTTLAVERLGDRVLVLQSTAGVLDVIQFRSRIDTDVDPIFDISVSPSTLTVQGGEQTDELPIVDLDLSAEDLTALGSLGQPAQVLSVGTVGGEAEPVALPMSRIDWLAVVGDEFVIGGDQLWRSSDGIDWEQAVGDTPRFGGLNAPGPDGVLTGLAFEGDDGYLTVSTDAGRSWTRLARPMENTWAMQSTHPIVAMTGWQEEPFTPTVSDWAVLTPTYELRIIGDGDSFELLDRSGDMLLSGATGDPSSGFRFTPGSAGVWFVDPATGEEIVRFPQSAFASAFAAARTLDGQPQLVAFANLTSPRDETLEWSLARVNELFGPEALAVDFIPGNGWLLADVTTTTGRELYIAAIPTPARPPSERRHPTAADMSRQLAEQD